MNKNFVDEMTKTTYEDSLNDTIYINDIIIYKLALYDVEQLRNGKIVLTKKVNNLVEVVTLTNEEARFCRISKGSLKKREKKYKNIKNKNLLIKKY